MKTEDRDRVLACLEQGSKALEEAVAGLGDAQLRSAPEGGWTPLGLLEHVAVTERFLLSRIQTARVEEGQAPSDPAKDDLLVSRVIGRSRKFAAPAGLVPSGRHESPAAAFAELAEVRRQTLDFVHGCQQDLRTLHCDHPLLGIIPAYNCLLLLAAHPARHAAQIREMVSAAREIG